jgi:hypothetical protein
VRKIAKIISSSFGFKLMYQLLLLTVCELQSDFLRNSCDKVITPGLKTALQHTFYGVNLYLMQN